MSDIKQNVLASISEDFLNINKISLIVKKIDVDVLQKMKEFIWDEYIKNEKDIKLKATFDRINALCSLVRVYEQTEEFMK